MGKIDLIYPELSYKIIGAAFRIFNEVGFGHKEIIYQRAFVKELEKLGIFCAPGYRLPIKFDGKIVGFYIPDLIINNQIIIEFKVRPKIGYVHIRQVVNYLRSDNKKLAIIIYFTREGVKYRRIINIKKEN
jgi:GxxExxY protein